MNNPQALYQQLMQSIKQKIIQGELQIGDKLDSERKMSEMYGINRMTVRNAIKNLEKEGIVTSFRGKGTFVTQIPTVHDRLQLGDSENISLSVQIRQKGMSSSRQVISLQVVDVPDVAKDFFSCEKVYELIRIFTINEEPYALQKTYLPTTLFHDMDRFDFQTCSLYEYMADHHHPTITQTSMLRITSLPVAYQSIMDVKANDPLFLFQYYGYDQHKEHVEYTISYNKPKYTCFKFVQDHTRK